MEVFLGNGSYNYMDELSIFIDGLLSDKRVDNIEILTPRQSTLAFEKWLMDSRGYKGLMKINVSSFERLFEGNIEKVFTNEDISIGNIGQIITFIDSAESVKDKLEIFSQSYDGNGFIEDALSIFSSLNLEFKTPSDLLYLSELLENSSLSLKLKDLALIYAEYLNRLEDHFESNEKKLDLFKKSLELTNKYENTIFIVLGFNGVNTKEINILRVLEKVGIKTIFSLVHSNSDTFNIPKQTFDKLQNNFEITSTIYIDTQSGKFEYKFEDMKEMTDNNANSDEYLIEANDVLTEVYLVFSKLIEHIKEDNITFDDISLVVTNLESYASPIMNIAKKLGLEVFIDEKKNITDSQMVKSIMASLNILTKDYTNKDCLIFLKYVTIGDVHFEVDRFENMILEKNIRIDEKIIDRMPEALAYLFKYSNTLSKEMSMKEYALLIKNLSEKFNISKSDEEIDSEIKLLNTQIWNGIVDILETMTGYFSQNKYQLEKLNRVFFMALNQHQITLLPPGKNSIVVNDFLRSIPNTSKVTFILGMMDSLFPKNSAAKGIFTDNELRVLKSNGFDIKNDSVYEISLQNLNLYRIMALTKDKIYYSYSRTDLNSNSYSKSLFLKHTQFNERNIFTVKENTLEQISIISNSKELYEQLVLSNYFNKENFDFNQFVDKNFTNTKFNYLDLKNVKNGVNLSHLNELRFSSSKLETYSKCPFKYFVDYQLKPFERRDSNLKGMDIGSYYHKGVNLFLEGLINKEIKSVEEIQNTLDQNEEFSSFNYSLKNQFIKKRATVLFNKLFSSIALSNENSEYEIFGSEIPFEIDLSKLNIKFDDKNISLQGVIDRIDILELDGVKYADIYDFKTGYKEISINKVLEGLDYQLILYALALLNTKLNFNNTKVSGIYYYLIEDRFSQDGEIEERLKNLLIGELEAIQKHNNEKIKPRSGNYIASDVFELLKEKMLSNLENSINNIIEGKMDPSPANDGNLFCEFCGYSSICRFEKDKSKDKIRVFAQSGQGKTNKMIIESLESQVKKHGD